MLHIIILLLGVASWGLLLWCMIRRKKYDKLKKARLQIAAWICCGVCLYFPTLCMFDAAQHKQVDILYDCTRAYHLGSVVLLSVCILLSVILAIVDRKQH